MRPVASLLLLSIFLLGLDASRAESSESSEEEVDSTHMNNVTWTRHYTFGFIEFTDVFEKQVTITPKTGERIRIKEQCSRTDKWLLGESLTLSATDMCETISILASADITVHGIVNSGEITGGFLALPNDYLGTEYLIDVYTPDSNTRPQAAISAISNNTNVTIDCQNNCNLDGYVILNEYDSVLLETNSTGGILTGTLVGADKPISVVVGSMNVEIPETSTQLGHGVIIEQLIPVSKWGRIHFVPPFQDATNGWVIRVMAYYSNTTVTLVKCGNNATNNKTLNSRNYIDIKVPESMNNTVCIIISDMPVQVMQYMASSTITEYGDPSMTLVPPVQSFHGNTTLRVKNGNDVLQYVDFVTTERGKDGLRLDGNAVTNFTGYCFNTTKELPAQGYCYFYTQLNKGMYHVTQNDQSETFLVRLYSQTKTVGGAMLADVSFQESEVPNITAGPSTELDTTIATTTEMSEEDIRTSLANRLKSQGDFKTFGEAEAAMSAFTDYLGDKEELGSVDDLVFAFDYFTEILKRKPLQYATGDNAQSFLGISSDAIHVLFADQTNQLLADACEQGTNLTSTPEDAERELEGLMSNAAALIVDGGNPSYGISRKNAGIAVSSTRTAGNSSATATVPTECEGFLDVNGVRIPCEVLKELGSRATYQINLPHGAEALARSSCEKYQETKSIVSSPLLGVGLISERTQQRFSSNITLSFLTTPNEVEFVDNNTLCSYWDYNTSDWSTSGCTVGEINNVTDDGTVVTCLCDHLTSFAVLLNVSSTRIPPADQFAMEIITWVGCCFSIVACFSTCFGYTILRLHSDLILIHGNLATAVGVAEIVFLCLNFVQYPSTPCTIVGALLYYQLLAMFAWMTIEGIHLYLLTFVVWNAERRKIKHYMACGWGVPVVFLIVLLSVYKGKLGEKVEYQNVCFLKFEDLSLLFLIVPVAIVIIFNLFVMIRVVLQIAKMADGPTLRSDVKSRVRHGMKAILILLPIMGLTWVFGFLAIERATVVFQYIFVILNSFQGVFIFFFHFVRNSEVRYALKRKRERWLISKSRQDDYRVKNTKKTTSSSVDKTCSSNAKTPEHTLTLMNVHTEHVYGGSIPDKNCN